MKTFFATMLIVLMTMAGVQTHRLSKTQEELAATNVMTDLCQARIKDLEEEVLEKNERLVYYTDRIAAVEEKYQGTVGYRTRRLLSKVNPFDDNITD